MDGSNGRRGSLPYRVIPGEEGWEVRHEDVHVGTFPTRDRAVAAARELAREFGGPVIALDSESSDA